ncbi:MarR family winged helix-turn-helix transcriptional regulator [Curtobacterium sp. MCSS17_007]|uniref:MarR family winged helix-turn-helix transcriptional regulator n=1 Tax=Curtobacterium sp. MCSS17_007 TaxID=2175646 RepID=UPI000DA9B4EB|nr:MarR family winged helix-turn-helix transcriptional regulator [Curtobacterium sp. MCSS17_007]WIE75358.1 MarR family winged helix-turn-helix transcriptional regulator [Curtobacterium sp. MCSS17_007]
MPSDFSVTGDDVDSVAAWTVIRAARELARRLAEELAPLDLTPVEFGALVQLASGGERNQAELARAVGVRPQSMAALMGGLETRGLVERGAAPGRGRASRLRLTRDGRELLADAWPRVRVSNAWFGDDVDGLVAALRPFTTDGSINAAVDGVV